MDAFYTWKCVRGKFFLWHFLAEPHVTCNSYRKHAVEQFKLYSWLIDHVGWDVLELPPSLAYCSSLGWTWAWELIITPDSSTRPFWQSYQQRHQERVGGMDEGMRISLIHCLWYVNGSFTCRKILRHGISGCTSHPKEGVLWILITFKNPCLSRV
jgi:hypothetical protein